MNAQDRQLVELVTAQVLAALRERGLSAGPSRAVVSPPAGTCTGRSPLRADAAAEAKGDGVGARAGELAGGAGASAAGVKILPLRGVVTAAQLQAAVDASGGEAVVLGHDARLTPLGNDLARKLGERVRRLSPGDEAAAGDGGARATGKVLPWVWWIDGHCPVVADVTAARRAKLVAAVASRTPGALPQVVRDLAQAVRGRAAAGGLLFVQTAGRATCFANRCGSLRAIVGTCDQAVEEGIGQLGANVLIIEYPHHGFRSVSAMVDRMLGQVPASPASVERDLADLHRCG